MRGKKKNKKILKFLKMLGLSFWFRPKLPAIFKKEVSRLPAK